MTTLIETMARAAFKKHQEVALATLFAGQEAPAPMAWEDLTEELQHPMIEAQRAALTAAREPTEAMRDAVFDPKLRRGPHFDDLWRTAIDAALGEKQP